LRGGSWANNSDYCRASNRNIYYYSDYSNINVGFRVARTP